MVYRGKQPGSRRARRSCRFLAAGPKPPQETFCFGGVAGFAGELERKAELAERHAAIIRGLLERSAAQAREAKEDAVTAADQRAA